VGALVGGATPPVLRRLTAYGQHLGLAFQITDDLLDAADDPRADGRTDRAQGKATYPAAVGVAAARRLARREGNAARAAVRSLGPAARPLAAIADFVVRRAVDDASGPPRCA
jgi:geranylgeranyl diphosphate synthase type II